MTNAPLTLREARTYGTLAVATALTASAGIGAGTGLAAGVTPGVVAGALTALASVGGALAAVRLLLTCPQQAG
jgi:hypothetical protein